MGAIPASPASSRAKRARVCAAPVELAAAICPAHRLVEVELPHGDGVSEVLPLPLTWEPGSTRPKVLGSVVGDSHGGLLISSGTRASRFRADGRHETVLRDRREHTILGTLVGDATEPETPPAAVLYEPETGRVVQRALGEDGALEEAAFEEAEPRVLVAFTAPFPKSTELTLHGIDVVVWKRHTHLQLLGPAADGRQAVKAEAKARVWGCPDFTVSGRRYAVVARPGTGEVFFLDQAGTCLYRWDTSAPGQVSRVADWDDTASASREAAASQARPAGAVKHLAVGPGFLFAWGGRGPSFRLLRIDFDTFVVRTVELLSEVNSIFRPHASKWTKLTISCDTLYLVVADSQEPRSTEGRVERVLRADLTHDELAPRCIEELHGVDWAGPFEAVRFRLSCSCSEAAGGSAGSRAEEEVLGVDRRVLCARSEYFRAMLRSGMQEAASGIVDLPPDVGSSAFRCLVDYLHTDHIDPLRASGVCGTSPEELESSALAKCAVLCLEVARLADTYQLLRLRRLAEAFVHTHALRVETVLPLVSRAHAANLEEMLEVCLKFLARHWAEVKRTRAEELEQLVRTDPGVAYILLQRCPTMK